MWKLAECAIAGIIKTSLNCSNSRQVFFTASNWLFISKTSPKSLLPFFVLNCTDWCHHTFKLTKSNSNINSFIILPTSTLQAQINYLQSGMITKEGEAISLRSFIMGMGTNWRLWILSGHFSSLILNDFHSKNGYNY